MKIDLYNHQKIAIEKLKTGSILCGGVGSGKSRTALAYYFVKECDGKIEANNNSGFVPMKKPKNLYIITTARKRDTLEWERECSLFLLSTNQEICICGVKVVVDSWNNIGKYVGVKDSFFIFDEQRVVGSGAWVKSFLKITKLNNWILLSATPGDTWMDYIPVFIANKFYKNKSEFIRRHVVYSRYTKFPKVDHYIECGRLIRLRNDILVDMKYTKATIPHIKNIIVPHDEVLEKRIVKDRWNIFTNKPIKTISEMCYLWRKVVNSDARRIEAVKLLLEEHPKVIIFYNYNYELDLLREMGEELDIPIAEWNGHKHETTPNTKRWVYLIQYTAGAEGWNCTETNIIIFYSLNYSYKIMTQAAGRIDRIDTPFTDLYYYRVRSTSKIDLAILKALKSKSDFNVRRFMASESLAPKTYAIIEGIE